MCYWHTVYQEFSSLSKKLVEHLDEDANILALLFLRFSAPATERQERGQFQIVLAIKTLYLPYYFEHCRSWLINDLPPLIAIWEVKEDVSF